jgi:uncharacterized protein
MRAKGARVATPTLVALFAIVCDAIFHVLVIAILTSVVQDTCLMTLKRLFFLGIGWFFVGLGILGIILPILPAVPFFIVSVWAFSKSSPALAEKLRRHPLFGHYIVAWEKHGVIPIKPKVLAIFFMSCSAIYTIFFSNVPTWFMYSFCGVLLAVGIFILSRPSHPPQES